MGEDGTHLVGGGDVDANLELALVTPVRVAISPAAAGTQTARDVLRDQPVLLGIGEDGRERHQHLAHQHRRPVGAQPTLGSRDGVVGFPTEIALRHLTCVT
jgi:hypothetical protein